MTTRGGRRFRARRARANGSRVLPTGAVTVVVVLAAVLAGLVVPSPSTAAGTITLGADCAVAGAVTEFGTKLISAPMAQQITGSPLAVTVPAEITATPAINPGGTIDTTAVMHLDLSGLADDLLQNRVKPAIVAAGYPQLASSAWVTLSLDTTAATFALPAGTTPTGTPTATASGVSATPAFSPGHVGVTLGTVSVDTRTSQPPIDITLSWSEVDGGAPAPRTVDLAAPALSFSSTTTIGLIFFGAPITGGVINPWSCTPNAPVGPVATTEVIDSPISTTTTTTGSSTTSTSSTSTTSTSSTTTTTWPSTIQTPPGSCTVSGFDRFDGFTGIALHTTGFFHTEQINGKWWLVDPDGHPFWSAGINHVNSVGTPDKNGHATYAETVAAKYGTQAAWADAQVARMHDWGYNTVGAWSDNDSFSTREPYTILLNLTGMNSSTGQMDDLWGPTWENGVLTIAAAQAAHKDDPYLLGYWLDNELHWGPDWRPLHLFDDYLSRPASAPGKQQMLTWLQQRYPTFTAFAADFTTTATDWTTLADPTTVTAYAHPTGDATRSAWVGVVAEQYFSFTENALRAADPNHLDLGPRFIAQTAGTPILEAAARHVDVASFNMYTILPELVAPLLGADPTYLPVDGPLTAQEEVLHKPVLISEWSYRAADSGLPNTWPPLFPTLQTQAQRAAAYEAYVRGLLNTPFVVGQHWFEHVDEPPLGRFDGEDSNFGLLNEQDVPYQPMIDISKTMHDCAYARLLAAAAAPGESTTTTSTAPPEPVPDAEAVLPDERTTSPAATPVVARPLFTG